jgi:hypothetical protein
MKNYKKYISTLFVFLLFVTWSNLSNAAAACEGTGTVASPITDTGAALECMSEPDIYRIKVYEMGLCTIKPTLTNMSTACNAISTITAGGLITVARGVETVVPGTFVRPINGTYNYGYLILAPEFRITATKTFTTTFTGKASTGTTCWSLDGILRDAGGTASYNSSGTMTPVSDDTRSTFLAECSATASDADPKETIIVQDSFNGTDLNGGGVATASFSVDGTSVTGTLTDDNYVIPGSSAAVTKLVGFVTFAKPLIITNDSSKFISSFKTIHGTLVSYADANKLTYFGSGPFFPKLSVE